MNGSEGAGMRLIHPTMEYDRQIQAYRQEFLDFGGSMDGCGSLRRFDRTQDWLDQVESLKSVETAPPELVPMSQYIYVRESDNKVVGVIQIRHFLNDFLAKYAGHIGYSVCPGERRKGYASQMLALVLPKCRELGIERVLITCIRGNEGSRKTILKNGGRYESTVYEEEHDRYLERYWIDLSAEDGLPADKTVCREAEPTDELVRELIAMSAEWEAENSCRGYRENGEEDISGNRIFIAERGGEIIGYLFGHAEEAKNESSVMPDGTPYFEVEELYVRPQYRCGGVGRALFSCAEEAVSGEAAFILLSTATKDWRAIMHFYIDELGMDFWNARLFKKLDRRGATP